MWHAGETASSTDRRTPGMRVDAFRTTFFPSEACLNANAPRRRGERERAIPFWPLRRATATDAATSALSLAPPVRSGSAYRARAAVHDGGLLVHPVPIGTAVVVYKA